ncbi:hypothetical protein CK203_062387 [Vitis vinifera]|uniref:Uncharacterized protein n=1 Tax=Vitis vinifera TaxID=29760 RepID=A0A438FSQ0_VITVI|nr:hypothetical protein CK203_062387 [Vitis vinifera]
MSSIYGKMDDCRIADLTKGLPELRLNSEGGYVETELGVKWPCSAIQISFNWQLCHHGASDGYLRSGGDFLAGGGDFLAGNGDFLAGSGDGVGSHSGSEDDSVRSIGSETFAFSLGDRYPDFWPLEELNRQWRGRCGSEVESWTGASLGILRQVDGDEDFAPHVLAMAVSAETTRDAHGLLSPFRNCETGVRRCEVALVCQRVVSQLRNTLRNGASAAKRWISKCGKNRSHFAAAKRWYLAVKWHSCAKEPLRSYENFRRGRKAAAKWFCSGDWFSQ